MGDGWFPEGNDAANKSYSNVTDLYRSENLVIIFMALYILLALLAIVGNALVVSAFKKVGTRRAINIFFVSLAVSDLMVGAISMPLWIYLISCPYLATSVKQNEHVVSFHRTFDVFSGLASISNLVAIAIERQFTICWPIQHRASSFARLYVMIIAIWSYALVVTVFYSIKFSPTWEMYRGALTFAAGFVIPSAVIILAYSCVYVRVRGMNEHWKKSSSKSSLRNSVQREKRTATTVVIVTVLFLLAWLPFFVVSLLFSFDPASLPVAKGPTALLYFVKWLHYSNSGVNPLVYTYRSEEMRKMLTKMLLRSTGRLRQDPRYIH